MVIINQIYYTIKRIFANSRAVLTKLLSFIVLILILGSAFSNAFDPLSLDKVKVAYFVGDTGESGKAFIDSMKDIDSINEYIELVPVSSFEKGEKALADQKAEAFIFIPKNFSEQVAQKDVQNDIEIYQRKYSGINATVIENVVESFVNGMNTAAAVFEMKGNLESFEFKADEGLSLEPLTASGNAPTSMGYYAVAMFLMMLLYGADYGCTGVSEDYLEVIGDRHKVSPLNPAARYAGKMIGLSLVSFIQGVIIIIFTRLVYKVDWGDNIPMILLITLTFSVLTTTLGAMLCLITRDEMKGSNLVLIAIIAFTFLAGGFVATDFPVIEYISPSYYAKTAIFNTVYNGSSSVVFRCIGIMWAITLVLGVISILAARRKRA